MSYSSETEISEEDYESLKQEFNECKLVHITDPGQSEVVFRAIILEDNTDTLSDDYSPNSPYRRYGTRSNRKSGKERPDIFSDQDYDDVEEQFDERYDEASFQDDYSDHGELAMGQQPLVRKVKKEEKDKIKIKKNKVNEIGKRTRKFALPWTAAESKTLAMLVGLYGAKEWQFVAKILQSKHNNNRTAAQCSQRWCRVINPAINKGPWEVREDKLLCEKFEDLQGSWCKIVKFFPDRTDTQCKRRYEKLVQMRTRGIQ